MPVKQLASFLSSRFAGRSVRPATSKPAARAAGRSVDHNSVMEHLEQRSLMSVALPPGAAVPLPGTTAAAEPALAGLVIRDALIPFSVNDGLGHVIFRGHLQDRVVRENGTGNLDFYQTIRADAGFTIPAVLQYVTRSSFGGWGVAADWRIDGLGDPTVKPERAVRSVDGKAVRFDFGNDRLDPTKMSLFYFARTNAKAFDLNGDTAIGFGQGPIPASGNGSVKLTTAEPVAPTTPGMVSGMVFHDINGDGMKQAVEPPMANVRVYDDANNNGAFDLGERTTLTNLIGRYTLAGLSPGVHRVREVAPVGARISTPAAGFHTVVVPAGVNVMNRNFGNTRTVLISGTVYNDLNANGVRDVGEAGLANFTVYDDANNNGVLDAGEKSTVTTASGSYSLKGLAPLVVHHVRVQPKLFWSVTAPATGQHAVFLGSGGVASGRNFGLHFRPIIFPVPDPIPLPLPIPDPIPLPIPLPGPIPGPDPGPIVLL